MAVYEVKILTEMFGQGAINRFYYLATGALETALDVADFAAQALIPRMANVMSADALVKGIAVRNVMDAADSVRVTGDIPGSRVSDGFSAFNAWSLQLHPSSGSFRKGGKRVQGVAETNIGDGEPTSGILPLLTDLADAFAWYLVIDSTTAIRPGMARELTPTSWLFSQLLGAGFNYLSTQNSRKPYKGGGPITNLGVTFNGVTEIELSSSGPSGSVVEGAETYVTEDLVFVRLDEANLNITAAGSPEGLDDCVTTTVNL